MQTHIFVHLQQHEITGLLCLLLLLCGVLLGARNSHSIKHYFEPAWVSWLASYFILNIILNTKFSLVCESMQCKISKISNAKLAPFELPQQKDTPWLTPPTGVTFIFFFILMFVYLFFFFVMLIFPSVKPFLNFFSLAVALDLSFKFLFFTAFFAVLQVKDSSFLYSEASWACLSLRYGSILVSNLSIVQRMIKPMPRGKVTYHQLSFLCLCRVVISSV